MTLLPDVEATLTTLASEIEAILGSALVGIYLYGSLASGDFDPATSDVDFLVITRDLLPDSTVRALEAMHVRLRDSGDKWATKLEGSYLPLAELPRFRPDGPAIPHVNEGAFYVNRHGPDWVLQRHIIREGEVVVRGPSIRHLIEPLHPDEIRTASLSNLHGWWEQMLTDPSRIRDAEYQAFAVLTMCRALRTAAEGDVVSKPEAGRWALAHLGPEWHDLVQQSLDWRPGRELDRLPEILDLIRYTLARADGCG